MHYLKLLLAGCLLALTACQTTPQTESPTIVVDPVADINVRLAAAYMREDRLELAMEKLKHALAVDPNMTSAHYTLGVLYDRLDEPDKADVHFRYALKLSPNDSEAHNNYGAYLCKHGQYAEAEKHFMAALASPRYRTPQLAWANAGSCAMKTGDDEKADIYLRKALELQSTLAPALIRMAELSYKAGRHMSARGYLQRYLQVAPQSANSLWLGVRIERELGDKDTAASYAMQLKSKYPDSMETRELHNSESR